MLRSSSNLLPHLTHWYSYKGIVPIHLDFTSVTGRVKNQAGARRRLTTRGMNAVPAKMLQKTGRPTRGGEPASITSNYMGSDPETDQLTYEDDGDRDAKMFSHFGRGRHPAMPR